MRQIEEMANFALQISLLKYIFPSSVKDIQLLWIYLSTYIKLFMLMIPIVINYIYLAD